MHILQNGIPKSGNLWLYKIISSLLSCCGIESPSYIQNHPCYPGLQKMDFDVEGMQGIDTLEIESHRCFAVVRQTFRLAIENLDSYVDSSGLVWTHSLWKPEISPLVYKRFEKIVYIIRDPRDALVSMSHFQFTPYKKLYHPTPNGSPESWLKNSASWWTQRWKQHVFEHIEQGANFNIHFIFYERILANPIEEIAKLSEYLELALPMSKIEQVQRETSANNMKSKAPHHVRTAKRGGWQSAIDAETEEKIWDVAGDLITDLGYTRQANPQNLPSLTKPSK